MVLEHNWRSTRSCSLRERLEMHYVEAIVVKRWSEKAESPPLTLCRTSRDIQREFMTNSGTGSRSVVIWGEDLLLLGIEDPAQLCWSTMSHTEWVRPKVGNEKLYFHCMIRWDRNELMSIYSEVCQKCTPRDSVHLRYPCISIHLPSHLKDVLGGCGWTSLEMHLEAIIMQV